jgi:hypothetical protein
MNLDLESKHYNNNNPNEFSCPSLCIPRVVSGINKEQVLKIIQRLHLGVIQRIDMIQKKSEKGELFSRVFIHFSKWYDSDVAVNAKERILLGKDIKVIYDEPWFWKISANRSSLSHQVNNKPK